MGYFIYGNAAPCPKSDLKKLKCAAYPSSFPSDTKNHGKLPPYKSISSIKGSHASNEKPNGAPLSLHVFYRDPFCPVAFNGEHLLILPSRFQE